MANPDKAGWYPDPNGKKGAERYWDGACWTDRVRTEGTSAFVEPAKPQPTKSASKGAKSFTEQIGALPTWAKIVIPLVAVIFVIGALSGDPEGDKDEDGPTAAEEAQDAADEKADARAEQAENRQIALEVCADEIEALTSSLGELDSRLSVGVQFADYTRYVGDARVAYDQTLKDISPECAATSGLKAEKALNIYIDAGNDWNDCIQDFGCDVDSLTLPDKWAQASLLVTGLQP